MLTSLLLVAQVYLGTLAESSGTLAESSPRTYAEAAAAAEREAVAVKRLRGKIVSEHDRAKSGVAAPRARAPKSRSLRAAQAADRAATERLERAEQSLAEASSKLAEVSKASVNAAYTRGKDEGRRQGTAEVVEELSHQHVAALDTRAEAAQRLTSRIERAQANAETEAMALAVARQAVVAGRTRVQAAAKSLADATHEAAALVEAERAGEDATARAVEGAAAEEQLVGQAVLKAEASDEEREKESARAIERAAEKVQETETRNVAEEKELQAVTEREGKSLVQQHQYLEQQVGAAMQALTSAQAELEASKRKEVEMLGRLEQVQSDARQLDAKLLAANPATVGVVHPEPIVALQQTKQTTGSTARSATRATRESDNAGEVDDSEDDEASDDAESDDDEDASDEPASKKLLNAKTGQASKSEFDLDLP